MDDQGAPAARRPVAELERQPGEGVSEPTSRESSTAKLPTETIIELVMSWLRLLRRQRRRVCVWNVSVRPEVVEE